MNFPRYSGILLHLTSLPGKFGIGDLGMEAYKFVDTLADTKQHLWQILPLMPTGYGNSPYNSVSIFAGNPLLISPELLLSQALIETEDTPNTPVFKEDRVDYQSVMKYKRGIIQKAFNKFKREGNHDINARFNTFCDEKSWWLEDYSLFMALKEHYRFSCWHEWPEDIKWRKIEALNKWKNELFNEINYYKFEQFLFFEQWNNLKNYCNRHHISVIGDIPIFVDKDSDAVWSHPELFQLDNNGNPIVVAGVPPDYFSKTGQLWGNPLYRWDVVKQDGFSWWVKRFREALNQLDIIRLDHFRGFESYWEIPANSENASEGKWMSGPGLALFEKLEQELGHLPIIAEDLGMINNEVLKLRDKLGFPGMRVLQFAFGDDLKTNDHKPFNHIRHCVVYTGTHDNDTTIGWFKSLGNSTLSIDDQKRERLRALKYVGTDGIEINWDFIRLAFSSVANTAIIPLQDVLGLGSESRMNTPSTTSGNWEWRFGHSMLTDDILNRLKDMTSTYGR